MPDEIDKFFSDVEQKENAFLRLVNLIRSKDQELKSAFRYNELNCDVEHNKSNRVFSNISKIGSMVNDNDIIGLRGYLTRKFNINPGKSDLWDAVIYIAMDNKTHPIKTYLESLKWDNKSRLDNWLKKSCNTPLNDYTKAVARKILIAAVARIYEPGCQFDTLVIFEGQQGIYKSTMLKILGGEWYAPLILTHNDKDLVDNMRGKWILEIEEMAGFSKQETERVKALISRRSDRVRLAYARATCDFPRQCILTATMNPDGDNKYLRDSENRRYWPIECKGKIDIEYLRDNRDQLFAEALIAYKKGEELWLVSDVADILAKEEQNKRKTFDVWETIIINWLNEKLKTGLKVEVTTKDILVDCLHCIPERLNLGHTQRVGRILAAYGWIRNRRNTIPRDFFYTPPQVEPENIEW